MMSKSLRLSWLWLVIMLGAGTLYEPVTTGAQQTVSTSGSPANVDVRGTWSGTFFSKNSNNASFTMTLVITANSESASNGRLTASSSLNSYCLKNAELVVGVNGSNVVLAGSDEDGDNITVRGTVDNTGTTLKGTYVINGSASGRCETDNGTGNLAKR